MGCAITASVVPVIETLQVVLLHVILTHLVTVLVRPWDTVETKIKALIESSWAKDFID